MGNWQATFLGLKQLPRELTAFEIEAFFTFTLAERQLIEDRRRPALKLGLALQIGFLRMSGRLLDAVRIVPPALWKHLGSQFGAQAPDLASLRLADPFEWRGARPRYRPRRPVYAKPVQRIHVETIVGMRNDRPGNSVDARITA